jgi:hypothetical protein
VILGKTAAAAALALGLGGWASAQEPSPPPETPTAFPVAAVSQAGERPGRFRVGPFYVTPTLKIGNIGLDTNVLYTSTDRQTDITASGGPGLRIVLPLGHSARLFTEGGAYYTYFVRTESQRKLGGNGQAGLEWTANRFKLKLAETYERSYNRPNFEVDRRVLQDRLGTIGELSIRTVGRLHLRTEVASQRIDVPDNQNFLGADLRRTMSGESHKAVLGLALGLTPKTSLLVEGDYQLDRFRFDTTRNADSNRIYGGFEIKSETRLSGRAVGGIRLFRPSELSGANRQEPYADVQLSYRLGPRTVLSASYTRDLAYSVFSVANAASVLANEAVGARLEKGLVGRVELFVWVRYYRLLSAGPVTVEQEGTPVTAVRDDKVREAGADLGYRFRSKLRIGVAAVYTERRSTFKDFGIQGLLVGGTVSFDPPKVLGAE